MLQGYVFQGISISKILSLGTGENMSDHKKKSDGFLIKMLEGMLYVGFVVIGFYLAFLIRFDMNPAVVNSEPFYENIPYMVLLSIVVFYLYDIVSTIKKSLFENAIIIVLSLAIIDILMMAIVFFNRGFAFPRSVFFIGFLVQFILIFVFKIIVLTILKHKRKTQGIMIIAPTKEAEYIAKKILLDKFNFDKVRFIVDKINNETYKLIEQVEKVYIGNEINEQDKLNLIKYCSDRNKTLYIVPGLFEIALINSKVTQVKDMLVFKVEGMGLTFEQTVVKRFMDIFISLVGLIVLLPFLIIIALGIKLSDRGPVFYKQKRVTKNNRIFNLYKFRTMVVNAEKGLGPVMASENDLRITPLGKLLRTFRIDEIPQLINVIKGEMSIVGPRPERPFFVKKLNEEMEEFKYRVLVKAGITGLAQILGKYSTTPESKIKYDLLYIRNYSLLLDIKIIFNTIKIMFIKDSSKGIAKARELEEIFKELDLNVYKEYGATRIE